MTASRDPRDLSLAMQDLYARFAQACSADPELQAANVTVLLTCTWRSDDDQAKLYAQGRTAPGPIVTRARPGLSKHNVTADGHPRAEAFDVVPLQHGKPLWDTAGADGAIWQRLGAIGASVGLEWYGAPDAPFKEYPHFQNPNVKGSQHV